MVGHCIVSCMLKLSRTLLLVTILAGVAGVTRASTPSVRGCGAYSRTGAFAAVSLDDTLKVAITPPHGKASELEMRLPFPASRCHVFFSNDSGLLAIGFDTPSKSPAMQIALLDVSRLRWIAPAPTRVKLAQDSRGELVGFVGDTNDLLVLNSGMYFASDDRATFFPVIVDPIEGKAATIALSISGRSLSRTNSAIDLSGRRIWVEEPHDNGCNLHSYPLGDKPDPGVRRIVDAGSLPADLLVATAHDAVLEIAHAGDGIVLRLVDTHSGKAERSVLSPHSSSDAYSVDGRYAVSADGRLVAIAVRRLTRSRLGSERVRNEIIVIDSGTLKVLGHVSVDEIPNDFAVAAIDGNVLITLLARSGWDSRTVTPNPQ